MKELRVLIARNRAGHGEAMPSVCSAHPEVIAASLRLARDRSAPLLIEATSNQVNQFGGYTGMRAADYIRFVRDIAGRSGCGDVTLLFGGDHLGPQVWRSEAPDRAMAHARDLVADYVRAGFTKIHLDCSEGCAGEAAQVTDAVSAARAAELAALCESVADDPSAISYVYGTEVPPPGGARADEAGQGIEPTKPHSARATIAAHREHFERLGLSEAFQRSVGLVVQPGLEFAPDHIHHFDPKRADDLSPVLDDLPWLSFEAHSTDYQKAGVYPELARRHFAVLKVGPALTFAYRQAVYALDAVARWLGGAPSPASLSAVMETLMREAPQNWMKHYGGSERELLLLRHFSYADRIRYYWAAPQAQTAVSDLMDRLTGPRPSDTLLCQFFAPSVLERAEPLERETKHWPRALIQAQIQDALAPYMFSPEVAA